MRAYIAGPMTGYPMLNHPAFREATKVLRDFGFEVVSPEEMDTEWGIDPSSDDPYRGLSVSPAEIMRQDLVAMLNCDYIILLPGWEGSQGARLERIVAESCGVGVRLYTCDPLNPVACAPPWDHPAIWRPKPPDPKNNDHEDDGN